MNDKLKVFKEDFKNEDGEVIKAVTILLDGKLKETLDLIIKDNPLFDSEEDLVIKALIQGLKDINQQTFYYN